MEITQIRVFPVADEKLKAFVSIIFDDCFVVSDIKIIDGVNGLFVSMPSKKRKNGTFRDIAHPLNNETRRMIEEKIVNEYKQNLQGSSADSGTQIRELGDEEDAGMKSPDTDKRKAGNEPLEGGDRSWT
jgi:stage V sporulation protein G